MTMILNWTTVDNISMYLIVDGTHFYWLLCQFMCLLVAAHLCIDLHYGFVRWWWHRAVSCADIGSHDQWLIVKWMHSSSKLRKCIDLEKWSVSATSCFMAAVWMSSLVEMSIVARIHPPNFAILSSSHLPFAAVMITDWLIVVCFLVDCVYHQWWRRSWSCASAKRCSVRSPFCFWYSSRFLMAFRSWYSVGCWARTFWGGSANEIAGGGSGLLEMAETYFVDVFCCCFCIRRQCITTLRHFWELLFHWKGIC
jgi:hypothetical protein